MIGFLCRGAKKLLINDDRMITFYQKGPSYPPLSLYLLF